MSSQGSGHSRSYRFEGHPVGNPHPPLPSNQEWVLANPAEEPGIDPTSHPRQQQYHLVPRSDQPALPGGIPVNLPLQENFQLVQSEQLLLASQGVPKSSSIIQHPVYGVSGPPQATAAIDIPQQIQLDSAGQSPLFDLLHQSYSSAEDYDPGSMYASVQAYYHPDITSHPSQQLIGSVGSSFSQIDSTNMFPQGNRQHAPVHPQQASWPQYQRSLSRTPEDPYQRRPQESLTPPAGYAPLPSQPAVFSNTSYPANLQQPQAQAFYPNSNAFGFNQPNYDFTQPSFVPSNAYPITTGPDPRIPIRTSPFPGSNNSTPTTPEPESQVRVLESRPKPQCWDHGCNGREFSTFSNLLRHQRERSGAAAKSECPHCGAVFTRTTARNTHISQGKCKGIRESTE
ncbi:hypothetical protein BGW36DRAFT_2313 [Talaromyces proteolyticus]|uniref:C2H2-type domain-containing protein n=1 Tax=Talaromyces proteolyticus TaxID=1131652 RepID=A0AAD4Q392_9EURO|nr:uncharacterized protein BGW36DRAFT_2313 [Talaromyces proteolyticus]KAH8704829.1 hypothetical protein BGW36DRAFT_2313 [Talaromyces proteolyticus]